MDSHFEVILERVKQLSNVTNQVVWFELYNSDSKTPSMILINKSNTIGLINLTYKGKTPILTGYLLGKNVYDDLVDTTIAFDQVRDHTKQTTPVPKLIQKIVKS